MVTRTLQKLADKRSQLVALISTLSEAQLDHPLGEPGEHWTIRETLTHLLNSEEDHCKVAVVISRGQHDRLPTDFSIDDHNRDRLDERGTMTRDELLAALETQRRRTVALIEGQDEGALAARGRHPALGEMSVSDIFRVIGVHENMHLKEIRAALERHGDDVS